MESVWEDRAIMEEEERSQSLDPQGVGNLPQKILKPIDLRPAGASTT